MSSDNLYLFADCIATEGFKNTLLVDFTRRKHFVFPSVYYKFLRERRINFNLLLKQFSAPQDEVELRKFIDFLQENELVFCCPLELDDQFDPIPETFNEPGALFSAVLELPTCDNPEYDLTEAIKCVSQHGVRHIQLISQDYVELFRIQKVLESLRTSSLRSIEMMFRFNPKYLNVEWSEIFKNHQRLANITIHSADQKANIDYGNNTGMGLLIWTPRKLDYQSHFTSLRRENFVYDLRYFMEAKHYNPYFHRKICVTERGHIKKCLSQEKSFGRINAVDMTKTVESIEYKQLDFINKDQVSGCKNCEYRYVCSDSRTPEPDQEGWKHNSNCFYDPLNGIWI